MVYPSWQVPFFAADTGCVCQSSLCICIFLPTLEVSIVSTSLVTLGNELHRFDQTPWVPNAYILTYSGMRPSSSSLHLNKAQIPPGFLMIWSRCGDTFGFKVALLSSLAVFVAFSGGCGAAQTLNQLFVPHRQLWYLANIERQNNMSCLPGDRCSGALCIKHVWLLAIDAPF